MRLELRAWRTELAMHPRITDLALCMCIVSKQESRLPHASHEIWNEEPATVAEVFSNIVLVMRKAPLSMHEGPLEGVPKIGCRCLEVSACMTGNQITCAGMRSCSTQQSAHITEFA